METVHDRYLSGSNVGNHLGDEEGVELRTVLMMSTVVAYFIFKSLNTTDTYSINNAYACLVFLFEIHAAVFNSLLSSNDGQLCVAIHLAGLLAINVVIDVKVLHLTSKLCLEFRGIEKRNRRSTALASYHALPSLLGRVTQRSNGTHASYYYSF